MNKFVFVFLAFAILLVVHLQATPSYAASCENQRSQLSGNYSLFEGFPDNYSNTGVPYMLDAETNTTFAGDTAFFDGIVRSMLLFPVIHLPDCRITKVTFVNDGTVQDGTAQSVGATPRPVALYPMNWTDTQTTQYWADGEFTWIHRQKTAQIPWNTVGGDYYFPNGVQVFFQKDFCAACFQASANITSLYSNWDIRANAALISKYITEAGIADEGMLLWYGNDTYLEFEYAPEVSVTVTTPLIDIEHPDIILGTAVIAVVVGAGLLVMHVPPVLTFVLVIAGSLSALVLGNVLERYWILLAVYAVGAYLVIRVIAGRGTSLENE